LHILIVEDNRAIAANLYDYLESQGHRVDVAHDGVKGFQLAARQSFDGILLDLGLPRMDGVALCQRLRRETGIDTPILMLTARDTLKEKLVGFESGADDYLVKPFALEEVHARLIALHKRRSGAMAERLVEAGALVLDSKKKSLQFAGIEVSLPPKCMRLIELLMREPGRLCSRQELEVELWGEEQDTSDRLRHHMHLLRNGLLRVGGRDLVRTVHGMGYRLEPENAQT
jgi:DNA-binding response OmpR family regulator